MAVTLDAQVQQVMGELMLNNARLAAVNSNLGEEVAALKKANEQLTAQLDGAAKELAALKAPVAPAPASTKGPKKSAAEPAA
jgi:uncharacterized protein (DUF885 family)